MGDFNAEAHKYFLKGFLIRVISRVLINEPTYLKKHENLKFIDLLVPNSNRIFHKWCAIGT